ncbi:MAG: peptidoglycan-associated lipoprotein [Myxococcota bacterium]|jgi:peptidoglycan-associated lipoprotein
MTPADTTARTLAMAFGLLLVLGALSLGGCSKSYPDCDDDSTCRAKGEVCVAEKCKQCRDDTQCAALDACMTCENNACVKRAGCCKSALDCPSGKCWKDPNDPSAPGTCGGNCRGGEDCAAGQKCANGNCVPDISCTDDTFCPTGQKCIEGSCQVAACEIVPVHFDFNEYTIRLDMEEVLSANASCIIQRAVKIRAEGHCDERGSDEYNLALGQRRAAAVVRQIQTLGVERSQMSVISYGEERPACGGSNESCWRQNRRVELVPR